MKIASTDLLESRYSRQVLQNRKVGLEKESLRVATDGGIAQTPHPRNLGSALTHPSITTDYSEALLELVTPPFNHFCDTLEFLDDTQRFVYGQLEDEILWATSMPCVVEGDASIPIAQYGSSNAGTDENRLPARPRPSLRAHDAGHRRRAFQLFLPEEFWQLYQSVVDDQREPAGAFISESYIGMVRNLQRYGWLVPYLFGASPAICASFLGARRPRCKSGDEYSYYAPYATSLRMGDIGYQNSKEGEAGIKVDYNSLQGYVDSLQLGDFDALPRL